MRLQDLPANEWIDANPEYGDWHYVFEHLVVEPVVGSNATKDRFDHAWVEEVTAFYATSNENGSGTELTLKAVMRLCDGRWAFIDAWNDYTGWGCQDQSIARVATSLDELLTHGVTPEDLVDLGLKRPATASSVSVSPPRDSGGQP